ncbi:MAG: ATP-binding protein, partial [Pseudomonadales bacterium]|nr:ATP-binding protein [Pseudomonadales bacterium]
APAIICISGKLEEGQACLLFEDTGSGIAPEDLDHVFEAFFTTRQESGGTGMGLYHSWQIIEKHAGSIDVVSKLGSGSCFNVKLPASI